ncbi:unnamed protein product [Brassicogethes aeneus]|uniref:Gamma-glutamyltransferase n=1 Tax=Brassicogethes aeneus TaxID=1431903 RepID=A0A9P0BLF9_BRAAE|nr:unnamed protein product [Brassicogethes aeneus]
MKKTWLTTRSPRWTDPVTSTLLKGETMYTSSEPGSGLLLTFIFNVLNGFIDENVNSYKNWQRIIEAFKHAYGLKTWLGDDPYLIREAKENLTSEEFAKATQKKIFDDRTCKKPTYYGAGNFPPPDTGSVNICVLDIYGDSVVLTSSLSRNFGAGIASQSTGIILNSQMGEFSSPCGHGEGCLPPNKANFIEHGKRPLTSMSPTVIVDIDNQMKFLVGATGGPRMITQIALTVLKKLWFNMTLEEAVQHPRFHHQLFPMVLYLEKEFDVKEQALVTAFRQIGHEIEIEECPTYAGVTAIYKDHNNLYAVTDPRRPGSSYYIYT